MKSLRNYIKESLEDFGIDSKSEKFTVAASAFYLNAVLKDDERWKDFNEFAKKWGYGKSLTEYDYSGRSAKKISTGPGLVMFKHKNFNPKSIEEIFEEMYNFTWYYVPDMHKWSTYSDGIYTCLGQGMYVNPDGTISKEKTESYKQFKWKAKDEKWMFDKNQEKMTNKHFIYAETRRMEYIPIVVPFEEVIAASKNESFVDEFTAALENNFASIKDDADKYNELQDKLKKEFEKRGLYRSLWSSGADVMKQLDSLTGNHANDIVELIDKEMGSWASTFNVPERVQKIICNKWKNDIEDEAMLRKWMSMNGNKTTDEYFDYKKYIKKNKIEVGD